MPPNPRKLATMPGTQTTNQKDQSMNKISTINAEAFRDSVFFSLTVRKPGVRTKVKNMEALEEYLKQLHAEGTEPQEAQPAVDAPKNFRANGNGSVKVTKRILLPKPATKEEPEADPYESAVAFLNGTKERLCGRFGRALPSRIKEGLFVVRKDLVQEFEDDLRASLAKLESDFIPAVLADYPEAKKRAEKTSVKAGGLGPLYREADYPTESDFVSQFGLEWQWLALGIPEDLPAALRAEAAAKLEAQFTEAANEVKDALRASFQELIAHATDKLSKPIGETGATFRDSMIGNIAQFCEVFQSRNLMNDTELEALVSQAKTVLTGVQPDRLRKFANIRESTQKAFQEIQTKLDSMLVSGKSRVFDLSDQ